MPNAELHDANLSVFAHTALRMADWEKEMTKRVRPIVCTVDGVDQGPITRPTCIFLTSVRTQVLTK